MSQTRNFKSFSYLEDGTVKYSILAIKETTENLKSGFYKLEGIPEQWTFSPQLSILEKFDLKSKIINYKELNTFHNYLEKFLNNDNKKLIESLGYKHKLGLILYGKQGTGKTVVTSQIADKIIDEGGIAINIDTGNLNAIPTLLSFLKDLRKVHDQKMLFIFDEGETLLEKLENEFKNFLDGYDSIDNSISIFTTNYFDKIPKAIYERPSRIKFCIELKGLSDQKIIENITAPALGRKLTELEIKELMGCTIDEIKEFIINDILKIEDKKDKQIKKQIGFK